MIAPDRLPNDAVSPYGWVKYKDGALDPDGAYLSVGSVFYLPAKREQFLEGVRAEVERLKAENECGGVHELASAKKCKMCDGLFCPKCMDTLADRVCINCADEMENDTL